MISLTASDFQKLAASGISADLAEQAQLRRVDSAEGGAIIGRNHGGDYSGIVFPYVVPGVGVVSHRLRRDKPDFEYRGGVLKDKDKYLSAPGYGNRLYLVPGTPAEWLEDTSLPICISEGEKKALALWTLAHHATAQPRFLPVALAGVWSWKGKVETATGPDGERRPVKGPIPDLLRIAWTGRRVIIIFDSNVRTNDYVRGARNQLARDLTDRGAVVEFVDVPDVEGVNGIDDILGIWGPEKTLALLDESKPFERKYFWNDTGNADRLSDRHGDDLIYCPERQNYYIWTGQRWEFDERFDVEKRAEETMCAAYAEAGKIEDKDDREHFLGFISKSLSRNSLANMAHLAKKKVSIHSATEFDADPWLLNVQNGTIDLKTGALRTHRREDLISKLIPLRYNPTATCPLFLRSLYRIMGDGPDASEEEINRSRRMVGYLQRLFGCAATGKPEKLLAIFYGAGGNNGKTTLLETIAKVLGGREYSTRIKVDSLMVNPKGVANDNATNADISDLQGARFAYTSEVEKGQRLSLARVKDLTGLGIVRARRMGRTSLVSSRRTRPFSTATTGQ